MTWPLVRVSGRWKAGASSIIEKESHESRHRDRSRGPIAHGDDLEARETAVARDLSHQAGVRRLSAGGGPRHAPLAPRSAAHDGPGSGRRRGRAVLPEG